MEGGVVSMDEMEGIEEDGQGQGPPLGAGSSPHHPHPPVSPPCRALRIKGVG